MNNILISSAGRRVSLVRFFKVELKKYFPQAQVLTTDSNPQHSAACMASDGYFQVPRNDDPNYISELLRIALENDVKLIIPTLDTELLILSESVEFFRMNNIEILISTPQLIEIFRNKRSTHDFFSKHGINPAAEYSRTDYKLPMYLKPIDGSRSVDNFIIREESDLTDYHFANEKLMFLEYLDHKKHSEYTIDMYYDRDGDLKCFIPRKRIEVRDGEVNKAATKKTSFVYELWNKLSYVNGFRGCITLQVFVNNDNGSLFGIEINPRFGGGYPLSYLAGANFPKWIIQEYLTSERLIPVFDQWEENLLMLRYDDEVLVHNYTH